MRDSACCGMCCRKRTWSLDSADIVKTVQLGASSGALANGIASHVPGSLKLAWRCGSCEREAWFLDHPA
ncbi:hypothetical protein BJY04DRAFT_182048 [Aspergillus karnatakaensis]|uniref:uncharacterized protein n=1 Tax=Aspergillus karnatakaensis TaxID=1810916 RepID=UPI003CCCB2EB